MIDLRSDTVTKPTDAMLRAMMQAEVGDDVFGEDPTINALQEKIASMFQMEDALFFPSGTMANQVAIKLHTNPLDELICAQDAHVFQYEVGGYAFHSQIGVNPLQAENGIINAAQIKKAIKAERDWLPRTRLVSIENSSNRTGGNIYQLSQIKNISKLCKSEGLKFHIDGARIFNAVLAGNYTTEDIGKSCDSLSICLSKGLGTPVGSVLLSTEQNIQTARRLRKAFGGGMRQAGILAAAGIYALDNHIARLEEDHIHAEKLQSSLENNSYVAAIRPVETNIVIFDLIEDIHATEFAEAMEANGIRVSIFGPHTIRMVTHLDVNSTDIEKVCTVLSSVDISAD